MRYGLDPLEIVRAVDAVADGLGGVYARQAAGEAWASPAALFDALGILNFTQTDAYAYFDAAGVDARFVREVVDGASRDNYNQARASGATRARRARSTRRSRRSLAGMQQLRSPPRLSNPRLSCSCSCSSLLLLVRRARSTRSSTSSRSRARASTGSRRLVFRDLALAQRMSS